MRSCPPWRLAYCPLRMGDVTASWIWQGLCRHASGPAQGSVDRPEKLGCSLVALTAWCCHWSPSVCVCVRERETESMYCMSKSKCMGDLGPWRPTSACLIHWNTMRVWTTYQICFIHTHLNIESFSGGMLPALRFMSVFITGTLFFSSSLPAFHSFSFSSQIWRSSECHFCDHSPPS